MYVGLIPPRGLENFALSSKFHLSLALPQLLGRRAYGGMYKRVIGMGDYVVLDNGACEGQLAANYLLWEMVEQFRPSELVVPDDMRGTDDTLLAVRQFFAGDYSYKSKQHPDMKYMAVVQGRTKADLHRCIEEYIPMPVNVIGIPRHLLSSAVTRTTESKTSVRIDLANWIEERFPGRFQIHFLGTNPVWIGEVRAAAKYASHVRSVDTSLPFNYALEGVALEVNNVMTRERINRPKLYFDSDWSRNVQVELLRRNIRSFMSWAGAKPQEVLVDRTTASAS